METLDFKDVPPVSTDVERQSSPGKKKIVPPPPKPPTQAIPSQSTQLEAIARHLIPVPTSPTLPPGSKRVSKSGTKRKVVMRDGAATLSSAGQEAGKPCWKSKSMTITIE